MPRLTPPLLLLLLPLLLPSVSVAHTPTPTPTPTPDVSSARRRCLSQLPLICNLRPTQNQTARGRVIFRPVFRVSRCLVLISVRVSGLTPGPHGIHIHTYGDLSSRDGSATGGHFTNPRGGDVMHGLPGDRVRHWGDFGSVRVGGNGRGGFRRVDRVIRLRGIVGRGMIVHELRDMGSAFQPSGAAGGRYAQCVIGFANPESIF
eukprot:GFKZ01007115.1.p1 GENE.GFKZ01007115.1~~GFKZ01007115.1.p1  ORF type:complete len:235 (+),score=10.67 GFKZ01007115.1:96-707(+)